MTQPATEDAKRFLKALDRNLGVIERNIGGIDLERSLLTVVPGGSHLNWLLGHLVVSRDSMVRALDPEGETVWDRDTATRYRRGSIPAVAPEALPMDELAGALKRSQELLATALAKADRATLERQSGDRTAGEWIEFLIWHETYHTGQTALYRRLAGLPGALG